MRVAFVHTYLYLYVCVVHEGRYVTCCEYLRVFVCVCAFWLQVFCAVFILL